MIEEVSAAALRALAGAGSMSPDVVVVVDRGIRSAPAPGVPYSDRTFMVAELCPLLTVIHGILAPIGLRGTKLSSRSSEHERPYDIGPVVIAILTVMWLGRALLHAVEHECRAVLQWLVN